jgi:hypothetical protein
MRILKNLLLFFLITVVMAIAVIRSPFVQKLLVVRYLEKHFNKISLEKVSIGLSIAKIQGLDLVLDDIDFKVENCDMKWSLKHLIFLGELKIRDMAVDGVSFSWHKSNPNNALQKDPLGLLKQAYHGAIENTVVKAFNTASFIYHPKLPYRTTIDHMTVNGFLEIYENAFATVAMECNGIAPLGTAVVNLKANANVDMNKTVDLDIDCNARISQSNDGLLDNMTAEITCAVISDVEQPQKVLDAQFSSRISDNENVYKLFVALDKAPDAICEAEVKLDKEKHRLVVNCGHAFNSSTLAQTMGERNLSKIETNLKINGEFDLNAWNGLLNSSFKCVCFGDAFIKIFPALKSDLSMSMDAGFKMSNGLLKMEFFNGMCSATDDSLKVFCYSTAPISVWNKPTGLVVDKNVFNPTQSSFKIVVEKFNPKLLIESESLLRVDALMSGAFDIFLGKQFFGARGDSENPLVLKNFTLFHDNKKYLENVNVACAANISLDDQIKIELDDVDIDFSNGDRITTINLSFLSSQKKLDRKINCYAVCNLDKLALLPLFPKDMFVKSGVCSGSMNFSQKDGSYKLASDFRLKSFALPENNIPINGEGEIIFSYGNKSFSASMELNASGKQTTSAYLTIQTDMDQSKSDVKFAGDSVYVPELLSILKIPEVLYSKYFRKSRLPKYSSLGKINDDQIGRINRISPALWSKFSGRYIVDLKKIFLDDTIVLDNFESLCIISDTKIDLKALDFFILGMPFNLNSQLECRTATAKPYHFALCSSLNTDDIGRLYKMFRPETPIEGAGKFSIQLHSDAVDTYGALTLLAGVLNVTCNSGNLYLLRLANKKICSIVDAIDVASGLLASKDEKAADIHSLVNNIRQVPYDDIDIVIRSNGDANVFLEKFMISGPELCIEASGGLSRSKYNKFIDSPIVIDVQTSVVGEYEHILRKLHLISPRSKSVGRVPGPRFVIKGTIGAPDYSDFMKILYSLDFF